MFGEGWFVVVSCQPTQEPTLTLTLEGFYGILMDKGTLKRKKKDKIATEIKYL